jgi:hypothetical protein
MPSPECAPTLYVPLSRLRGGMMYGSCCRLFTDCSTITSPGRNDVWLLLPPVHRLFTKALSVGLSLLPIASQPACKPIPRSFQTVSLDCYYCCLLLAERSSAAHGVLVRLCSPVVAGERPFPIAWRSGKRSSPLMIPNGLQMDMGYIMMY